MLNPFELLGVNRSSTDEEIRNSFIKLAAVHHPDKSGDSEKFIEVNQAYQTIRTKFSRNLFVESLKLTHTPCSLCSGRGVFVRSKSITQRSTKTCTSCWGLGLTERKRK